MKQNPKFFSDQQQFREWLRKNHKIETELWVGYYKKGSGLPSMTWPESVDQALCYGWIDGLRKSIDEKSYKIRFTPRKPKSNWSPVNIKKVAELKRKRLMRKAGIAAYEKRGKTRPGFYSYEKASIEFDEIYKSQLKKNKRAWDYFHTSPQGYRRQVVRWIMSAKRAETQQRRLELLIKHSAVGEKLPQYDWKKKVE
ncbi:MAG: YdeI/OmpD-associated family protein [Acidobacteriota bacterium]|nr:YdeI/OmpD-associated family protein [Acidobacteriota bacterium]MDH3530355.1 YdeI/OmpD-associated family protein [Acidobacteriota bacterium]